MKHVPHPIGQRWGDKVRRDYENHQQIDKTSTCDHVYWMPWTQKRGDAITKMILDKTKIKARWSAEKVKIN